MDDARGLLVFSSAKGFFESDRRSYMDAVALEICFGSLRIAERRFGWGRQAVLIGLYEREHGVVPATQPSNVGRRCPERVNP